MPASALTNLQRELLDLFATDLSEEDLLEVREVLARHFADKATVSFNRLADDRGLSADDLGRLAHGHERARTDRPASAGGGA